MTRYTYLYGMPVHIPDVPEALQREIFEKWNDLEVEDE